MANFRTFNVFTVPLEEAHKRRATMIVGEAIENRDGTISIRLTAPLPFGFDGRLSLAERVAPAPSSPRPPSGGGTVQLSDRAREAAAAGRRLPTHDEQAASIQRELDARGQTFPEALADLSKKRHVPGVKNSTGYIGDPPRCSAMLLAEGLCCELEAGHEGKHAAKAHRWEECQPSKAAGGAE